MSILRTYLEDNYIGILGMDVDLPGHSGQQLRFRCLRVLHTCRIYVSLMTHKYAIVHLPIGQTSYWVLWGKGEAYRGCFQVATLSIDRPHTYGPAISLAREESPIVFVRHCSHCSDVRVGNRWIPVFAPFYISRMPAMPNIYLIRALYELLSKWRRGNLQNLTGASRTIQDTSLGPHS